MSEHTITAQRTASRPDPTPPATGAGRWLASLGIAFTILFALGFIVFGGKDFDVNANPSRIVDYYHAHYNEGLMGSFAVALGTIAFAFFAGVLRNSLQSGRSPARNLSSIIGVGTAIYLGGLLLQVVVQFGLVDAAHHRQAAVVQTLNYLDQDDFFPTIAGLAIFMLATGAAILRTRALPVWLGWSALVLGVLALAGPLGAIAFMIAPLWTLATSIVLLRRGTPISEGAFDAPVAAVAI
jgi:hypothetical protein